MLNSKILKSVLQLLIAASIVVGCSAPVAQDIKIESTSLLQEMVTAQAAAQVIPDTKTADIAIESTTLQTADLTAYPLQTALIKTEVEPDAIRLSTKKTTIKPKAKVIIVYGTKTGKKYHRSWCRSLAKSKIRMTLTQAKAKKLTPCKICH